MKITTLAWQVSIVVCLFGAWQAAADYDPVVKDVIGSPDLTLASLVATVRSGQIFRDLGITASEAAIGFAAGTCLGALVAFTFTFVPVLGRLLDPLIGVLSVMPRIVLAPVFMVWFGLGITSKAALVTTIVFFIVYFNVDAGLRSVEGALIERARTMGANLFGMIWEIYVPASIVWILAGLRVSVGFALLGAIVAEYLGANAGIGAHIATAQSLNDPNAVMAGLAVVLLIVVPLDRALIYVEARASVWRD